MPFTKIFKKSSTTYFYSSIFFPPQVRDQVTRLYAFVRTLDDYVDQAKPDIDQMLAFIAEYNRCFQGESVSNPIITSFVQLERELQFDHQWVVAFFEAMRQDISKKKYHTLNETIDYMYGSAEVIGLMMAKVLRLPTASYAGAQLQGRAMQYINFIRDINEDLGLGRTYIPATLLKKYGLTDLQESTVKSNLSAFKQLLTEAITDYREWQNQANQSYHYIPYRYRVAIATAAEMYEWTAQQILKNPLEIYRRKIKPSKWQVVATALKHGISELFRR